MLIDQACSLELKAPSPEKNMAVVQEMNSGTDNVKAKWGAAYLRKKFESNSP